MNNNISSKTTFKDKPNLRKFNPYFLIIPSFIILLGVTVYPIIYSINLSFHNQTGQFVGWENYLSVLKDQDYLWAWVRTFFFSILAILFETLLGVMLALAVDNRFVRNKSFLQTAFIIPMMIAPIAVGVTFKIMYHPLIGVINYFLSWFAVAPIDWLGNAISAFIAVLIVEVWRGTPFIFLLAYAGLQTIPKDMYEAAALDGARPRKMFIDITLSWLRPTLLLAIALRILDMFTVFDEIMGVTAGGPGTSTEMVSIYIYKTSFRFQQFNIGAAMSVLFLIATVLIAVGILKHSFRAEEE